MKIQINHSLLSDSPFCEANQGLFSSPLSVTEHLVQDIKNGPPTCYLISGYRGVGKSSFSNRIEKELKKIGGEKIQKSAIQNDSSDDRSVVNEVVFIHVNFSRYHNQTHLLRKLIRGLYLEIAKTESFQLKKTEELKEPTGKHSLRLLEELYEKTFYDTSYNLIKSNKKEIISVLNIDLLALSKLILPLLFLAFFIFNWKLELISTFSSFNLLGSIASLVTTLFGFFNLNRTIKKNRTEQQDFTRRSMYDDEIADHHFLSVLKSLQNNHYKVVFVLDELDKVDDDDMDNLLKEIKPYLVSGYASFIAVAGQNLFYKYENAKSIDDDVLSSIFSNFIHIPLFSREESRDLFSRLIQNKFEQTDSEKNNINVFLDSLIFESKRVPRKFISLIRQNLIWENNNSFIEITQSDELTVFSKMLDIIENIETEEIETEEFDDALCDYFVMNLFIKCHQILFSKKTTFSYDEIVGLDEQVDPNKISQKFHEKLRPFLSYHLDILLAELEKEKIITEDAEKKKYKLNLKPIAEDSNKIQIKRDIFQQLIEFRDLSKNIYANLNYSDSESSRDFPLSVILSKFEELGAISIPWKNNSIVVKTLNNLDPLVGDEIRDGIEKMVSDNKIRINSLNIQLLEFYGFEKAIGFFSDYNYNMVEGKNSEKHNNPLIISHADTNYPDLIFDFKYRKQTVLPKRDTILSSFKLLEERKKITGRSPFLFLIIFTEQYLSSFEKIKFQFAQLLQESNEYNDKIILVPVSIKNIHFIESAFKEFRDNYIEQDFSFGFKNQNPPKNFPGRNDHFIEKTFEIKKHNFEVNIKPGTTQFWRFGFKFSKTGKFPPLTEDRHKNDSTADIHINVGDLKQEKEGYNWIHSHQLGLAEYNISPIRDEFNSINNYEGEDVILTVKSNNDPSEVEFELKTKNKSLGRKVFNLQEFNFCKIHAWCDYTNFHLNTNIKVFHKNNFL